MKMFTWSQKPFFLATAHAESVADARRMLVETEDLGESGDGTCPEHDRARKIILEMTPNIWTGANAEFALTDSAEVAEYEHNFRVMGDKIKQLEASLASAKQEIAELRLSMEGWQRTSDENRKQRQAAEAELAACRERKC